MRTVMIKRRRI